MIYTEEEAKKRYCAMAGANSQTGNILCAASHCMAWRWWHEEAPFMIFLEGTDFLGIKGSVFTPDEMKYLRGFCGLAGKPGGGK